MNRARRTDEDTSLRSELLNQLYGFFFDVFRRPVGQRRFEADVAKQRGSRIITPNLENVVTAVPLNRIKPVGLEFIDHNGKDFFGLSIGVEEELQPSLLNRLGTGTLNNRATTANAASADFLGGKWRR